MAKKRTPRIRPPKHIHKYVRFTMKGDKKAHWSQRYDVMRCVDPDCTSFIRVELAMGKQSRCNRCDKPFILDGERIKKRKPHCDDCTANYKYRPGTKYKTRAEKLSAEPKDKDVNKLLDTLLGDLTGLEGE